MNLIWFATIVTYAHPNLFVNQSFAVKSYWKDAFHSQNVKFFDRYRAWRKIDKAERVKDEWNHSMEVNNREVMTWIEFAVTTWSKALSLKRV